MPFKTDLDMRSIRGTKYRELLNPLRYYSKEKGITITVPVGFKTDFASIPRLVRPFIDNDSGQIRDAAVIHDYLYSNESTDYHPQVDRMQADEILMEGMRDLGANWLKRHIVHSSVVVAGWMFYKKADK